MFENKEEKKKEQNDKRTFIYLFIHLFSWTAQEERKCLRRREYGFKSSQQLERKIIFRRTVRT